MEARKRRKSTEEYFDSVAENYDTSHDGKFVYSMYREILQRVMEKKAERILDLGCGNGNVLALLKKEMGNRQYYGIDLSRNMIKEARRRLGGEVSLEVGDVEQLPYQEKFFDLIICNASFHHYVHPQKAVEEMKRVLKPGGTVILGDPTTPFRWLVSLMNWFIKYSDSGDEQLWHKKDIISLFEKNGFKVENWKYLDHHTFMFDGILT